MTLESDEIKTPNPDGWFYDGEGWRCELWVQNREAVSFYDSFLATQWRQSFNGPTGLDYNVLLHELDRRNLPPDEYDDLFWALRVIESTALEEFHRKT